MVVRSYKSDRIPHMIKSHPTQPIINWYDYPHGTHLGPTWLYTITLAVVARRKEKNRNKWYRTCPPNILLRKKVRGRVTSLMLIALHCPSYEIHIADRFGIKRPWASIVLNLFFYISLWHNPHCRKLGIPWFYEEKGKKINDYDTAIACTTLNWFTSSLHT